MRLQKKNILIIQNKKYIENILFCKLYYPINFKYFNSE